MLLRELVACYETISPMVSDLVSVEAAFRFGGILRKMEGHYVGFMKQKKALLEAHGTLDETKQGFYKFTNPDNELEFYKQINDLLAIDIDEKFGRVSIALLEKEKINGASVQIIWNLLYDSKDK